MTGIAPDDRALLAGMLPESLSPDAAADLPGAEPVLSDLVDLARGR